VYEVEIYENNHGNSELKDWLHELKRRKDKGIKDARIILNQIQYCIERIKLDGTYAPEEIAKHTLMTYGSYVQINIGLCFSKRKKVDSFC
jgi:hypothetical protein